MIATVIALIVCCAVVPVYNAPFAIGSCWSDGNGVRSGDWWPTGSSVIRGRYIYKCVDGQLKPDGCNDLNGQRMEIGRGSYVDNGFVFNCTLDNTGRLTFAPTGCVDRSGIKRRIGSKWDNPEGAPYWYECERRNVNGRTELSVVTRGCLVQGTRFAIGDQTEMGDGYWQCQARPNGTQMCLLGCMYENKRVALGQTTDGGDSFTYTCKSNGGTPLMQCVGCQVRNARVANNERYFKDDAVYRCEVKYDPRTNTTLKRHKLVGCLERDRNGETRGECVLGGSWNENDDKCKYEYFCTEDGKKQGVGCTLHDEQGKDYLFVPVNSYTVYNYPTGSKAIGCKVISGRLDYYEFEVMEIPIKAFGLQYATPRGRK